MVKNSRWLLVFIGIVLVSFPAWSQTHEPDSTFVRNHYTKHDYRIAMRDGVKLYTVVYIPKDSSELHPMLMTRTPYSVGPYGDQNYVMSLLNLTRHYFQRNYIMVYQDVRGQYMSEGTFVDVRPYIAQKKSKDDIDESSDSYDTIDWLIHNVPHNNGKVGVRGSSYPGFYSTMASIDAHPALIASSPQAPVSAWMKGDDWIHNGAFLLPHLFDFYAGFGWPRVKPTEDDSHSFEFGTNDGYKFFMNLGALSNINPRYYHDSVAFWNTFISHGTWDSFWEERDVLKHVKDIKPATMIVGGWFDTENLFGALNLYQQIKADNPSGHHAIVMGPWAHGRWLRDNVDSLGPIKFGMNLSNFYADSLEVPYFEYYLRGKGEEPFAGATVFETGANVWRRFESWPPKEAEQRNLYLHTDGKLSFVKPENTERGFDEYASDPQKPVPYTSEIRHWYNGIYG